MFHSHLPIKFWGERILVSTHLFNRLPSRILDQKSPYELLYHTKPDLTNLRIFRCLVYSTITKPIHDKFGPRAIKIVFLGYIVGEKSYKLYDLERHTIYSSRDVKFFQDYFPFSLSSKKINDDEVTPEPIFKDLDTTSDTNPTPDSSLATPTESHPTVLSPAPSLSCSLDESQISALQVQLLNPVVVLELVNLLLG